MDMGIRTELSTNPAMLLGGLTEGVTPLEMAYAYSTLANNGERRSSTLAPDDTGPVAIERVEAADGSEVEERELVKERVFPAKVGQLAKEMLSLVVTSGTGKAAQVGDEDIWGKTGTTENYGDAWFVGGNDEMTVAVWVGYADKVQSMEYEHAGGPVAGGTFPAEIFSDFMSSWVELRDARRAARGDQDDDDETEVYTPPSTTVDPNAVPEAEQPVETTPDDSGGGEAPENETPETPPEEVPETPATPAPTPPETPPPTGGEGGGGTAPGSP